MKELAMKDQMQRERRGSDLRDGLLSLVIGSTRKACRDSVRADARAEKKKKRRKSVRARTSRKTFYMLKMGKAKAHQRWQKHTFFEKSCFWWFWRLLAAFWELWKPIKEEEAFIVRYSNDSNSNNNNTTQHMHIEVVWKWREGSHIKATWKRREGTHIDAARKKR